MNKEEIFVKYEKFVRKICRDKYPEDPISLESDTWLKIMKSREFDTEVHQTILNLLSKIVHSCFVDLLSKEKRYKKNNLESLDLIDSSISYSDEKNYKKERWRRLAILRKAMDKLPIDMANACKMYRQDKSFQEIADAYDWPLRKAKRKVQRGKQKLRKLHEV